MYILQNSVCAVGLQGPNCENPCSYCQSSVPCMRSNGECYLSKCRKTSRDTCDIGWKTFLKRLYALNPLHKISQLMTARFLNGVNVAFNRPAKQSSTYKEFYASLAVDGNNDTNVNDGRSCSHTNKDEKPWFYVDLEVERHINKVIITNREDIATGLKRQLL